MEIIRLDTKYLNSIIELIYKTTIEFNTSDVIKNDNKSKKIFKQMFIESFEEMEVFGTFIDNKLVGVIGLEDKNYINILYVDKEYQMNGIGTELLNYIIKYISSDISKIEVCAAAKAVNFYLKNGFQKYENQYGNKIMMYYNVKEKKYGK